MIRQGLEKKVYVGMSGGVDSSVSAALLQKAGYDVTGVFIKVWQPEWYECTWKEDRLDAMRVCAKLGIPFRDLDLSKQYKKEVVDYMISEYKAGRTPNPDVMCNKSVKFGGFFDWAMKEGADFVATGHYAQVKQEKTGKFSMMESKDKNKDQTYFLWTLTETQLSKTLFPVGGLTKPEVRKLAEKFELSTAQKKDSQGLCFIGKIDVADFLSHYIKPKAGNVLNEKGNMIGTHNGAFFLTIGQRRGFTITEKHPDDRPYFVVSKNVSRNEVVVSNTYRENQDTFGRSEISLIETNWINKLPASNEKYFVRSRYRQPLEDASIIITSKRKAVVVFEKPQLAISEGQSLVVYGKKEECLGGGIIE